MKKKIHKKVKTEINLLLHYLYRDADNYKTSSRLIFQGLLTKKQIQDIKDVLTDDCFVPHQVSLPDLQGELQQYDKEDHDVDHPYHELIEIANTNEKATEKMTAQKLYDNFREVNSWDFEEQVTHIKFK